jgi:hypothetical protein
MRHHVVTIRNGFDALGHQVNPDKVLNSIRELGCIPVYPFSASLSSAEAGDKVTFMVKRSASLPRAPALTMNVLEVVSWNDSLSQVCSIHLNHRPTQLVYFTESVTFDNQTLK